MCGVFSAECPSVTAANFESTLATDIVFVGFFNDFLSLPCFPESLRFNWDTGFLEVESGQAQSVSLNIRSYLHNFLSSSEPGELANTPLIDNGYTVCFIDSKQGIEWVMRERLPFFLKSDFYFEYRFAKLLLQWELFLGVQKRAIISAQSERTQALSDTVPRSASCFEPERQRTDSSSPQAPSLSPADASADTCEEPCVNDSPKSELECLAATLAEQALHAAVRIMGGHNRANSPTCLHKSGEEETNRPPALDASSESEVPLGSPATAPRERPDPSTEASSEGPGGDSWKDGQNVCTYGKCGNIGKSLFKEFLKGTLGEGLLYLWMDIERMKATEVWERKKRCLALMRSKFLMSTSQTCMNVQLLSRLGLSTSICWTPEKLQAVQPQITHTLLSYWASRFWTSHKVDDEDDPHDPTIWTYFSSTCTIEENLFRNEIDSLSTPSSQTYTNHELCPSRGLSLATGPKERMIQALCAETGAGLYFTYFCEQSSTRLWANAIYFWSDLQNYHELFHQEGLDPYRVQREAQLLYGTFLCSSARRSLGIHEETRRNVCRRLIPAFEELFDDIEEHVLNILLEPWTILFNRDKKCFQQVPLEEETRRLDTPEYRELEILYEKSATRLKQEQYESVASAPESPTIKVPKMSETWSKVASEYKGYRLGSLLRQREEMGQFMKFLQSQAASIHLSCWLDLEQYRRIPETDSAVRTERSAHLVKRYLHKKYFFGPESPASMEQQREILELTGGLERLNLDCLSNIIVSAIQDILRSHIESTLLPEFLSTAEFVKRQKDKLVKHTAVKTSDGRKGRHRRKARREAWQCKGLWMSSPEEILAFRRVLIDRTACLQFQYFVYPKGEFLENDVRFWLEVQRYKDLCHSHSDDETIQQKISVIIECFIDSYIPPALQIDIPDEQAVNILEKRHALGPYIFREAQTSVFNELVRFWPEFQQLRNSIPEAQLMPLLIKKKEKHRKKVRRQKQRELEKEEEERRDLEQERQRQDDVDIDGEDSQNAGSVLSISYCEFMAAKRKEEKKKKKEEKKKKRKNQMDASSSSSSSYSSFSDDSSSSDRSTGTAMSQMQPSVYSRASSQPRRRYSRGVKSFNMK